MLVSYSMQRSSKKARLSYFSFVDDDTWFSPLTLAVDDLSSLPCFYGFCLYSFRLAAIGAEISNGGWWRICRRGGRRYHDSCKTLAGARLTQQH